MARQQLAETVLFRALRRRGAQHLGRTGQLSESGQSGAHHRRHRQRLGAGLSFSETDLGRIRLNQQAEVTVDAYPDRSWKGRVSYISSAAEFTPRSVQTTEERTNLVYRVKIQLKQFGRGPQTGHAGRCSHRGGTMSQSAAVVQATGVPPNLWRTEGGGWNFPFGGTRRNRRTGGGRTGAGKTTTLRHAGRLFGPLRMERSRWPAAAYRRKAARSKPTWRT